MSGAAPPAATPRKHTTVLVVEDDPGAMETFEHILTLSGYDVRGAADAETGLRELTRTTPAAILIDLHLPLADGVEFLQRLRSLEPYARIPSAVR